MDGRHLLHREGREPTNRFVQREPNEEPAAIARCPLIGTRELDLEGEGRQLRQVRQEEEEEMMEQQPINILLAAVMTLGALCAITMTTILLDIVLCGGNCLVPPS